MKIDNKASVNFKKYGVQLHITVTPHVDNHHKAFDALHIEGPPEWVEAAQIALANSYLVRKTRHFNSTAIRVLDENEARGFLNGYVAARDRKNHYIAGSKDQ